jgi:prolyl-tRNA synthetase
MYRWSNLFIPTLREAPADAEVASHKFLLRSGYIRQVAAGVYSYLLLGQRSINKIQAIVRQEMDRIGQEFLLPALHPRELWEESGRWTVMGQNLFKLQDRKGAWLVLGMTEEEVMTDIARKELRSYKQLPQIWYQIQAKFRDEPRPRAGLLRVRQFIMKDSYSFDLDAAGLDLSYNKHDAVYRAILKRCGLNFVAVQADSGAMGGSQSQEFMVYAEAGEDLIASCPTCNYAANVEKATSYLPPVEDVPGNGALELVHTPGRRTIADVGALLELEPVHQIKTMAYMALTAKAKVGAAETASPVVVLLRGDHTLNLAKLAALFPAARELRPMAPEEIVATFHAPAGYLGVAGLDILAPGEEPEAGRATVVLDQALEGRHNLVAGANREEYHLRNVTPGRDFIPTLTADVRNVVEGESCPQCPASPGSPLKVAKAIEVGHIFKLGYRYSDGMGVRVLDPGGKEVTPIMGCYGMGIERILTAAIEQNHDGNGFWLARSIAPFDVVVTVTNMGDPNLAATAEQVAKRLEDAGFDVLLDDRDERAGVKFKDADLVGIPYRINVGKKAAEGRLELVTRATASSQDVNITEIAERVKEVAQ